MILPQRPPKSIKPSERGKRIKPPSKYVYIFFVAYGTLEKPATGRTSEAEPELLCATPVALYTSITGKVAERFPVLSP